MPKTDRIGVNCALSTPFTAGGAIDHSLLIEHARWVLAAGADGITLFGTTGEGAGIGLHERIGAMGALAGAGFDFRRSVVVSVTSSTIEDAVGQTRAGYAYGARAILITPSFYFPDMPEDGIFDWFSTVFQELGTELRDILLYHIPNMTRSQITPHLVSRLRDAFGDAIVGIKDSAGNWEATQALLDAHRDFQVLVGSERHVAQAVSEGGSGTICGLANFQPALLRGPVAAGRDEPLIMAYRSAILPDPFPASLKALVARRTGRQEWLRMRPPNVTFDDARVTALMTRIEQVRALQ